MSTLTAMTVLGLSFFLAVSSADAQGNIYKWIDAQGRIHYSDTPIAEAESIDDALPPASNFGTLAEQEDPTAVSTAPLPEPTLPPPTTAEIPPTEATAIPPSASPSAEEDAEEEPEASAPLAADESPSADDQAPSASTEPTAGEGFGPAVGEEEEVSSPTEASAESFNFTAFDDFVPGGLEGGEALDDESFAAEGIEEDEEAE